VQAGATRTGWSAIYLGYFGDWAACQSILLPWGVILSEVTDPANGFAPRSYIAFPQVDISAYAMSDSRGAADRGRTVTCAAVLRVRSNRDHADRQAAVRFLL